MNINHANELFCGDFWPAFVMICCTTHIFVEDFKVIFPGIFNALSFKTCHFSSRKAWKQCILGSKYRNFSRGSAPNPAGGLRTPPRPPVPRGGCYKASPCATALWKLNLLKNGPHLKWLYSTLIFISPSKRHVYVQPRCTWMKDAYVHISE